MSNPIVILDIFPSAHAVTGIRADNQANSVVIITGDCPLLNPEKPTDTRGMIYRGPIAPNNTSGCQWDNANSLGCICRFPPIIDVVSAVFYGPDTSVFTPTMGDGNVRIVGSYRLKKGSVSQYDHGVKYQGPLRDKELEDPARWLTIDMNPHQALGPVANTILHSTMGELIVGNYDTLVHQENLPEKIASGKFNAFIYNIGHNLCFDLKRLLQLENEPGKLITAYGIWRNTTDSNPDTTSYTIAGGLWDENVGTNGLNVGLLLDFDSKTLAISNVTQFSFGNVPGALTHFEGITKYGEAMTPYGPRYYALAATGDEKNVSRGAAFGVVKRKDDGSFEIQAEWQPVNVSGSTITTGNTVLQNNLYGIYSPGPNNSAFQSYVAENLPVVI